MQIERLSGRGSATEAARTSTMNGLTDLTVRIPAEYFRIAGQQAQEYLRYSFLSVPHHLPAVMLMQRYSIEARELVSAFAPASTELSIDMAPVLAQAERVMPEVKEALRDNASRRQFENGGGQDQSRG